ncbi:MAG: carboxypeptidase-like regulatory domain-containing protein, partial [Bacteroidota bacterium]
MKLCHSGLLAICLLCCVLVSGIAQQTDQTTTTADGTIEITATYQQQSLLNILSDIQSKHRIRFFFQKEQLPAEARSFSFQQTPLTAVLDQLFEGTRLSYFQYRDYAIMVLPRDMVSEFYTANYYKALEESLRQDEAVAALERQITIGDISKLGSSGNATVNGVILDSQTKDPIIGATLLITDMGSGTTTDADGNFELTLPTGKHDIVVQYVG